MTRNVLVTGATGFIGAHLVRRLVNENWRVTAIVRHTSDLSMLAGVHTDVEFYEYDGSSGSLQQALRSTRPELVVHLASCFLSSHRAEQISDLIASNVTFGTQLVDAMIECGCTRLVNTGSAWQHYHAADYSPVNLYAATKQAYEAILQYYVDALQLSVITLKLSDTYGPNDPRPKLFSVLREASEAAAAIAMSPGEQLIDLVYVDDVIEAFLLAADQALRMPPRHVQYAVSSGAPVKLRKLAEIYTEVTGGVLDRVGQTALSEPRSHAAVE